MSGGGGLTEQPTGIEAQGSAHILTDERISTPGIEQDLITYLVPAGKTVKLHQVKVSCNRTATWKVLSDSTLIGFGTNGAANPDSIHSWPRSQIVDAGVTIYVKFLQIQTAGTQAEFAIDIRSQLNASLIDI